MVFDKRNACSIKTSIDQQEIGTISWPLFTGSPLTSNVQVAPTSPPPPPGASLCLAWSHAERTQVQYHDIMSEECNVQSSPNNRAVLLGGPAGGAGLQVAGGAVPVREAPDI